MCQHLILTFKENYKNKNTRHTWSLCSTVSGEDVCAWTNSRGEETRVKKQAVVPCSNVTVLYLSEDERTSCLENAGQKYLLVWLVITWLLL